LIGEGWPGCRRGQGNDFVVVNLTARPNIGAQEPSHRSHKKTISDGGYARYDDNRGLGTSRESIGGLKVEGVHRRMEEEGLVFLKRM
jgi:hypothetical protein